MQNSHLPENQSDRRGFLRFASKRVIIVTACVVVGLWLVAKMLASVGEPPHHPGQTAAVERSTAQAFSVSHEESTGGEEETAQEAGRSADASHTVGPDSPETATEPSSTVKSGSSHPTETSNSHLNSAHGD
ncbi:MAG: hypothetical protein R6U50_05225, partial [Desulfobacterales bacterium]